MQCNPTMTKLQHVKDVLLCIMQNGPHNHDYGICDNVDEALTAYPFIDCYPILRDLVQKWPDAVMEYDDGDVSAHFIPPFSGPYVRGWRWIDKQGDLRMQAMQFMVAEIDRRLAAVSALTA